MNKIHYRKTGDPKWKYELTQDFVCWVGDFPEFNHEYFEVGADGIGIARAGYRFDGVTLFKDCNSLMSGACVHDYLLQAVDMKLIEPEARSKAHRRYYWHCRKETLWELLLAMLTYTGIKIGYPIYKRMAK